jgi:hypothetical protein
MHRKPIGVWISAALAIFILADWLGWKLGGAIAVNWHRAHPRAAANLTIEQRRHLEAELSDLEAAELLSVLTVARSGNQKQGNQFSPLNIRRLEAFRHTAKTDEIKPIFDLHVGFAYVLEAIADQRDNKKESAVTYIKATQPLFQSLGWRDTSEDTLESAANDYSDQQLPLTGGAKCPAQRASSILSRW